MSTTHTHIEDAEKDQVMADPEKILTDDELEDGGLRPIKAFVRTRASKNALRVAKSKEAKAEQGIKQVNVQAPEPVHSVLKEIAKLTSAGESIAEAIAHAVPELAPKPVEAPVSPVIADQPTQKLLDAVKKPGFRSWMIKKLAGI
jgi:hypothetical protein